LTAKTHSLLNIWAARRIIEKGVCVNLADKHKLFRY